MHKINVEDDDIDDTMTFDTQAVWKFNKEKSFPLTGDERLTLLNLILVVSNAF